MSLIYNFNCRTELLYSKHTEFWTSTVCSAIRQNNVEHRNVFEVKARLSLIAKIRFRIRHSFVSKEQLNFACQVTGPNSKSMGLYTVFHFVFDNL